MKEYDPTFLKRKIAYPYVKRGDEYIQIDGCKPSNENSPIYEARIDAGEQYFVPIPNLTYVHGVGYYTSSLF